LTAGNSARQGKASWGAGVILETGWCDQNVGNAKCHGAEHRGTIQCIACDGTFLTAKHLMPKMLDSCPTKTICTFFHKAWWYMDAYHQFVSCQWYDLNTDVWFSKGLNEKQAKFSVKKYHSHHRCGPSIMMSLGLLDNPL